MTTTASECENLSHLFSTEKRRILRMESAIRASATRSPEESMCDTALLPLCLNLVCVVANTLLIKGGMSRPKAMLSQHTVASLDL